MSDFPVIFRPVDKAGTSFVEMATKEKQQDLIDLIGEANATPTENTVLDRLKDIYEAVDGLELIVGDIDLNTDQLENLITATNNAIASLEAANDVSGDDIVSAVDSAKTTLNTTLQSLQSSNELHSDEEQVLLNSLIDAVTAFNLSFDNTDFATETTLSAFKDEVKAEFDETQALVGEVSDTPTTNTIMDRLKNIYEAVDGLELSIDNIDVNTDQLETLVTATNQALADLEAANDLSGDDIVTAVNDCCATLQSVINTLKLSNETHSDEEQVLLNSLIDAVTAFNLSFDNRDLATETTLQSIDAELATQQKDALTDAELRATDVQVNDDLVQSINSDIRELIRNKTEDLIVYSSSPLMPGESFDTGYIDLLNNPDIYFFWYAYVEPASAIQTWSEDGINPLVDPATGKTSALANIELDVEESNGSYIVNVRPSRPKLARYVKFVITNGGTDQTNIAPVSTLPDTEAFLWTFQESYNGSYVGLDSPLTNLSSFQLGRNVQVGLNPDDSPENIASPGFYSQQGASVARSAGVEFVGQAWSKVNGYGSHMFVVFGDKPLVEDYYTDAQGISGVVLIEVSEDGENKTTDFVLELGTNPPGEFAIFTFGFKYFRVRVAPPIADEGFFLVNAVAFNGTPTPPIRSIDSEFTGRGLAITSRSVFFGRPEGSTTNDPFEAVQTDGKGRILTNGGSKFTRLLNRQVENDEELRTDVEPTSKMERVVTDGVITSGSATFTSATANFTDTDYHAFVDATGIPAKTYIIDIVSSTEVTLSANALVSGTGVEANINKAVNIIASAPIGSAMSDAVWRQVLIELSPTRNPERFRYREGAKYTERYDGW